MDLTALPILPKNPPSLSSSGPLGRGCKGDDEYNRVEGDGEGTDRGTAGDHGCWVRVVTPSGANDCTGTVEQAAAAATERNFLWNLIGLVLILLGPIEETK